MKKILLCLGFLSIVFIGQANASEIAIINLDEVVKNSVAMGKINKSLEGKKSELEKKFKSKEKTLNNEKNSLEAQIKTLSQDVAQQKVVDFQQKVIDFQKEVRESESNLQKKYMDAVIEVTNKVKEIVANMKSEKDSKYDFDVVLPASSVIYNEKSIDISSEVLSRLNKQLKNLKTVSIK